MIALLALFAVTCNLGPKTHEPPTMSAPILVKESAFPGDGATAVDGENVHDPTVIPYAGRYFCFSTSGWGFGAVRSSKAMLSWKIEGPLLPDMPEWITAKYPGAHSMWAPDILMLGKRFRSYYCVSRQFGSNSSVIGLAECDEFDPDHPLKGWRDEGLVIESVAGTDTFNAIDPETTIDARGRHWLYFGSYFAGIYVVELDPVSGKIKPGAERTLVARNLTDRGNAVEGAAVCRRDPYYYLFVSYGLAGQGVRSTYRIMVGRSLSPSGPFLDANGRSMADGGHTEVLKSSPPMFSPGHCDVFRDPSGRYLMPYHFYDGRRYWVRDMWGLPTLQIRELLWTEDGWPLPGLPVQFKVPGPAEAKSPVGKWIHQADFAQPLVVELKGDGTISGGRSTGQWESKGSNLTLKWARDDEPGEYWTDEVQLAYKGRYYVGRNQAGMVIRGMRLENGER